MTQKTKAQLAAENIVNITSNGVGSITGPILNGQFQDVFDSVATTLDANTFTPVQTFTGGVIMGTMPIVGVVTNAAGGALQSDTLLPVSLGGTGVTTLAALFAAIIAGLPSTDPHILNAPWINGQSLSISQG